MLNRLKAYSKKTVLLLKYFCIMFSGMLHSAKTNSPILFDVDHLDINRRTAQIYLQLINAGYEVHLKISARAYVNTVYDGMHDYQRFMIQPLRYYNKRTLYKAVFCAKENKTPYPKRIVINNDMSSFKNAKANDFFFPILFHPLKMAKNNEREILSRKKEIKIGIVFIGNTGDAYNNQRDILHDTYHLDTRNEVMDFILSNFRNNVYRPDTKEQFEKDLLCEANDLTDKIVIIDRFRIDGDEFFQVLGYSAFFIWTAGYIQPYCHNQAESMACGAVPIRNRKIVYPGLGTSDQYTYDSLEQMGYILKDLLSNNICTDDITAQCEDIKKNYIDKSSIEAFHNKLESFIDSKDIIRTYYICVRE